MKRVVTHETEDGLMVTEEVSYTVPISTGEVAFAVVCGILGGVLLLLLFVAMGIV